VRNDNDNANLVLPLEFRDAILRYRSDGRIRTCYLVEEVLHGHALDQEIVDSHSLRTLSALACVPVWSRSHEVVTRHAPAPLNLHLNMTERQRVEALYPFCHKRQNAQYGFDVSYVQGIQIHRPIIYGNSSFPLTQAERDASPAPDHTHRWTVAIRSAASPPNDRVDQVGGADDLSYFIKRVTFRLHETYPQQNRSTSFAYKMIEKGLIDCEA